MPVIVEMGFHYGAQAGLKLLDSSNAPASGSLSSWNVGHYLTRLAEHPEGKSAL